MEYKAIRAVLIEGQLRQVFFEAQRRVTIDGGKKGLCFLPVRKSPFLKKELWWHTKEEKGRKATKRFKLK